MTNNKKDHELVIPNKRGTRVAKIIQPVRVGPVEMTWKKTNIKGIFVFSVIIGIAFLYVVNLMLTSQSIPEIMRRDFISILPYLIVGSISGIFAFLDLYERFPDFGVKLPLKTSAGWAYLFINAIIAAIVLFGYLNYLPLIGDIWTTSITIAFTYPMLIKSKFFTITAPSGEKISAGPELLFDRVQTFLVNQTLCSTKILRLRRNLIKDCSEAFGLLTLKTEAHLLIGNRTDWDQEKRDKGKEKIDNIASSQDLSNDEKEYEIAKYILLNGGVDYLRQMTREMTDLEKRKKIIMGVEEYKLSQTIVPRMLFQEPSLA